MIAIITGDIIKSANHSPAEWLPRLKEYFSRFGEAPLQWEIYRGDEFQLKVNERNALHTALKIKAMMKSVKGLDVRMGIGIGLETFQGSGVTESNGPAYRRSGRNLDALKQSKVNLSIATGHSDKDAVLNLMFRLALDFMDHWSAVSAEIVSLMLDDVHAPQKEIAKQLGIKQSAVSQRLKRARFELVLELLHFYSEYMKTDTSS
ncbi:SatD family protein [Maribacter sp. 2307ULW6-5]|uniref:SatD family protein n=1 Tax=Maribacter sp. 2307ULW6-5 TaxID=3386275 RepID=UPI0039BD013A